MSDGLWKDKKNQYEPIRTLTALREVLDRHAALIWESYYREMMFGPEKEEFKPGPDWTALRELLRIKDEMLGWTWQEPGPPTSWTPTEFYLMWSRLTHQQRVDYVHALIA